MYLIHILTPCQNIFSSNVSMYICLCLAAYNVLYAIKSKRNNAHKKLLKRVIVINFSPHCLEKLFDTIMRKEKIIATDDNQDISQMKILNLVQFNS